MAKTYNFTDSNSSDVTTGSDFNKTAEITTPVEASHSKTNIAGGAAGLVTHTYSTEVNIPSLTIWPAGDYISRVNCSVIGADVTFTIAFCRIDSTGALVETLGTSTSFNSTGLKSFTHNIVSNKSVNIGDRFQVRIAVSRAASHGNQTLTLTIGTAGAISQLETPLTSRRRINTT